MLVVVDTGMGNVKSVLNMLKKLGISAIISSQGEDINAATKIILPGVGSFDSGMESLSRNGLDIVLEKKVLIDKTPILGICLGMQLFAKSSEEGSRAGLGWIAGQVKKFSFSKDRSVLKIPNMGWRTLMLRDDNRSVLFQGFTGQPRFYFVHSYHLSLNDPDVSVVNSDYGYPFCAAIQKGNIYGVQFHPEKSHQYGMILLKNFAMSG